MVQDLDTFQARVNSDGTDRAGGQGRKKCSWRFGDTVVILRAADLRLTGGPIFNYLSPRYPDSQSQSSLRHARLPLRQ